MHPSSQERVAFCLKNGAIFFGLMYVVSFIILFPFWLRNTHAMGAQAVLLLVAVLIALTAHIIMHWLERAMTAVPALMVGVLAGAGFVVWVYTPTIMAPLNMLTRMTGGFDKTGLAGAILSGAVPYLAEYASRLGLALAVLGGVLWWVVKEGRRVERLALGVYLTGIAAFGVFSGGGAYTYLLPFLAIWLLAYLRTREGADVAGLGRVFQVVATVAIVTAALSGGLVDSITRLSMSLLPGQHTHGAYAVFLTVWRYLWAAVLLFGVWGSGLLLRALPAAWREKLNCCLATAVRAMFTQPRA